MYFNQKTFGKKIRCLRISKDMSQEELAVVVHAERSHIAKIETGTRACSLDLLIDFSNIFQVSTDYLLFEVETRTSENVKEELAIVAEKLLEIIGKL